MFGNHTNLFCHAVIFFLKSGEAVNKYLFCMGYHHITWTLCNACSPTFYWPVSVPHDHVECAPSMVHIRQKKHLFLNWLYNFS